MKLTHYMIHICNCYMYFTFDVQAPSDAGMFYTVEIRRETVALLPSLALQKSCTQPVVKVMQTGYLKLQNTMCIYLF